MTEDKNQIPGKKDSEKKGDKGKEQVKENKKPDREKMITVKESEYKKLKEEVNDYKDKYIRIFAEFDNARKRMERDKFEFVKYANEGLLTQFLNILDDFERSVEAARANHQDYSAFLKGIELVMAHIYEMLKKNNVKLIEAKGKKFDPNFHEALMKVESDDLEDGSIVEEFQKGYTLGDRVVRTSKVKVATVKDLKENSNKVKDQEKDKKQ